MTEGAPARKLVSRLRLCVVVVCFLCIWRRVKYTASATSTHTSSDPNTMPGRIKSGSATGATAIRECPLTKNKDDSLSHRGRGTGPRRSWCCAVGRLPGVKESVGMQKERRHVAQTLKIVGERRIQPRPGAPEPIQSSGKRSGEGADWNKTGVEREEWIGARSYIDRWAS
jgi:hypothetical protein